MTLFITSEVMFFGALIGSFLALDPTPPQDHTGLLVPLALTAVLLSSSITAHLASTALAQEQKAARWLWLTLALGACFLVGQGYEYANLPFGPGDSAFATLFFTLTGFHGAHVAAGLVMLAAVAGAGAPARPTEAVVYYWHFVDGVWLAVFTTAYLVR
jgi:heme/copper-type cytochrome/quinol oxidase subunit 3